MLSIDSERSRRSVGLAAVVFLGTGAGIALTAFRQPSPPEPVVASTERLAASDSPSGSPTGSAGSVAPAAHTEASNDAVLTAANNADLRNLLRLTDVDSTVPEFAERYAGMTIEFDGAVLECRGAR